jgi:type II secretory pathway component PulM
MSALNAKLAAASDRVQDGLADMTPRDRALLLGTVAFFAIALVGGAVWWMRSSLSALEGRLDDRQEALRRVQILAADFDETRNQTATIEAAIQKHASTSLSTFLEQAAQRAKVADKLDQVKERSTTVTGTLEEKTFAVKLSKLDQAQLNAFLYHTETQGYPLQVQGMKVKTRKSGEDMLLDVEIDIAAYKVVAATGEPG